MASVVRSQAVRGHPWAPYRSSYASDVPSGCPCPWVVRPCPFRRARQVPSGLPVPFRASSRRDPVAYFRVVAFPCDGAYCLVPRDLRSAKEAYEDFAGGFRDDFRDGFLDGSPDDCPGGAADDDSYHPLSLAAFRPFLLDPYQLGSFHLSYCYRDRARPDSSAAVVVLRDLRGGLQGRLHRNSDRCLQDHY